MPMSLASRGLPNTTSLPSIRTSPEVGLCTPESVLISVDLPAPLSPSRQSTSPAWTFSEMSCRTSIGPKDLLTLLSSRIGVCHHFLPLLRAVGERHLAEGVVHQHGEQQQDADDQARPVGVEVGEVDALVHDREGQRAEDDADDRAEAAGQEHAADHDRDDGVEDVGHAARDLRGVVEDRLAHADEGGAGRGERRTG